MTIGGAFRAGGASASAGRKGGVQAEVHHVLPVAAGGANELANLETRCRDCHLGAHKRRLTPVEAAWQRFIAELQ